MNELKNPIFHHIQAHDRVAIHLDNSSLWLQIDKYLTEIGAVIIPIPHFFSSNQISHMLESAGINKILCETAFSHQWQNFGFENKEEPVASLGITLLSKPIDNVPLLPLGTHKITFTSGTTGTPKGVCLSAQHLNNVGKSLAKITQQFNVKRHLSILPFSVLLENIASNYAAPINEIEVISPSLEELGIAGSSQSDISKLLKAIEKYKPDSLILMPQMLKGLCMLLKHSPDAFDLSHLKFIAVGGAVCSKGLLQQAQKLNLPVFEGYGISECGSVISLNTDVNNIGSVGKVLSHQQVKISKTGEILTHGNLFLGYLGDVASYQKSDDWYATGDLGQFDADNNLHIIGRKKNIIINSFGRNISPDWIEAELQAIDAIQQVVVYGEAMPYLTAICVSQLNADNLWPSVDKINATLPDYAQIRQLIISSVPFTPQNKMLSAAGHYQFKVIFNHFNQQLKEKYAHSQAITA